MKSLGLEEPSRPNVEASRRDTMHGFWQQAGLQSIDTAVIRIRVAYDDFDDFWASSSLPIGPSGKALAALSPDQIEQIKARLREQLPFAADGSITYEAFANAVKGRVPANP